MRGAQALVQEFQNVGGGDHVFITMQLIFILDAERLGRMIKLVVYLEVLPLIQKVPKITERMKVIILVPLPYKCYMHVAMSMKFLKRRSVHNVHAYF